MRNCPACEQSGAQLKYKENINLNNLDEFAFSSRKLPELMHRELFECIQCKTLFDPNVHSSDDFKVLYEQADFDSGEMAYNAAVTYTKYLQKQKLISGMSILDIGTGDGAFLLQAKLNGAKDLTGIEPSYAAIKNANKEILQNIRVGNVESVDLDNKKFDLITFFMTIEHVVNPDQVMERVKALLETNGTFAIVCHDRKSLVNRILGKKSPIFDIEHIQIFSKRGIKKFMERNFFTNIKIVSIRNSYPLHYWIRLAPIPKKIKKSKFIQDNFLFKKTIGFKVGNLLVTGQLNKH